MKRLGMGILISPNLTTMNIVRITFGTSLLGPREETELIYQLFAM
jgi:hypothetical protein